MRKQVFIIFCLVAGLSAQAQVSLSAGFSANGTGFKEQYATGAEHEGYYSLAPTLRVGYRWANGLSAGLGAELSYLRDSRHYGYDYDVQPAVGNPAELYSPTSQYYDETLEWTAGGWLRYDLPLTSRLSLFANLSVGGGSLYKRVTRENWVYDELTGQREQRITENVIYGNRNNTVTTLNVCLTPGVACRLGSHWQAELWLDLLQVSYLLFTVTEKSESQIWPPNVDKADGYITKLHLDMFHFGSRQSEWFLNSSAMNRPQPYGGTFHLACTYVF